MTFPLCDYNDPRLKGGPYTLHQIDSNEVRSDDWGLIYGYCYEPQRFSSPQAGVSGTTPFYPIKDCDFDYMPVCDTPEAAIKILSDGGWYGRVVRFCRDVKSYDPDAKLTYTDYDRWKGGETIATRHRYRPTSLLHRECVVALVNVPKPPPGEQTQVFLGLGEIRGDIALYYAGETEPVTVAELWRRSA
jgi:hypothetical protein